MSAEEEKKNSEQQAPLTEPNRRENVNATGSLQAANNGNKPANKGASKKNIKLTLELLIPSMKNEIAAKKETTAATEEASAEVKGHVSRLIEYLKEIQTLLGGEEGAEGRFAELKQFSINEITALREKTPDPDDLLEEYPELAKLMDELDLLQERKSEDTAPTTAPAANAPAAPATNAPAAPATNALAAPATNASAANAHAAPGTPVASGNTATGGNRSRTRKRKPAKKH